MFNNSIIHIIQVNSEADIYVALGKLRSLIGSYFDEMDRQKILVSASELLRNILDHADAKGTFKCRLLYSDSKIGVQIKAVDYGPGIVDVGKIFEGERNPASEGLGIGLSSVRRLMDEFCIDTSPAGTIVTSVKWLK